MFNYLRFLSLATLFSVGVGSASMAASFDCSKATTETEIAICADPELSALDNRLGKVYARSRQVTKNVVGQNLTIQKDQIDWLKKRNRCGSEMVCLLTAYQTRLEELKDFDFENLFNFAELEKQTCNDQTEVDFASGITKKMLYASDEYNQCLEKIIINLIISTTIADKQLVTNDFKDLKNSYERITYHIFNSLKECSPYCGSMYRLYPSSEYREILTKMLLMVKTATHVTEEPMIPKADEILLSFPVCKFNSSIGQWCKTYDAGERQSVRIFTDQMVKNINLGNTASEIETDSWYYTISEVEKAMGGFSFIFTDDGKFTPYLSSTKYFADFDHGSQLWRIIGEELIYLSGPDQKNVGRYIPYDVPVILSID